MKPMYSHNWFETFAATVPETATHADLTGISSACPKQDYPRLLELGCGTGRVAGPLAKLGYQVTGLDINPEALLTARRNASGPQYIVLDQQYVGRMDWQFDAAIVLWNSLGFVDRSTDLSTLTGLAKVVRPGGKLILDLYHPGWLEQNQQSGKLDPRRTVIHRWLLAGRSYHEIRYPDSTVDHMSFNVYLPEEMQDLLAQAGFRTQTEMVWWDPKKKPSADYARYQLVCVREPHVRSILG